MLDTHQLLTNDLQLNSDLNAFLRKDKWKDCKKYLTVAIIGAQGTGKSTLMNRMFGERFIEQDPDEKNSRTTVGANLSIIKEEDNKCFLLIDAEGNGGLARKEELKDDKEEQAEFESKLASFILYSVDVLMINIMANQVSQVEGSGSKIIREIIKVNRKYLQPKDIKKTIIYVIRDYNKKRNKDALIKTIEESIFKREINKQDDPENYEEFEYRTEFIENYDIKYQFIENYEDENSQAAKNSSDELK